MATNIRNLFEAAQLYAFSASNANLVGGAAGGTTNGAELGKYEYHTALFVGTVGNTGTFNVYACTDSSGNNPRVIRSVAVGSSNSGGVAVDVKSSALGSLAASVGTQYTHLGVMGTVDAGGTWKGGFCIISYSARVSPPGTSGLAAYGTYLT
jgi:hypothetical protein